ncbi:hypothetical protein [Acidithiobacillus ferrivorans]|uniref:Uncharacterized protein n=1 Tax=Acidithiobacillus ferrivorans TaxID=160808 RepID=A0A7T5BI55_9PROT|nr:hypothetical protein [Acidithiobacillus ferrivorans]QQD72933.1 hypothetical protein H2515_00905 [Acidithiobacillus ferrivorans]
MLNFLPLLILEIVIVSLGAWFSITIIRAAALSKKADRKPAEPGSNDTAHEC